MNEAGNEALCHCGLVRPTTNPSKLSLLETNLDPFSLKS